MARRIDYDYEDEHEHDQESDTEAKVAERPPESETAASDARRPCLFDYDHDTEHEHEEWPEGEATFGLSDLDIRPECPVAKRVRIAARRAQLYPENEDAL
jgi:hypothetical protein